MDQKHGVKSLYNFYFTFPESKNIVFAPSLLLILRFLTVAFIITHYGAPFVKILYLTDLAQKLLSLAEIAISACRDIICGRDSYLCVQRCYLFQR